MFTKTNLGLRQWTQSIFIAKKIDNLTHRVVLLLNLEINFLDFEFRKMTLKLDAIVKNSTERYLFMPLVDDFRLLLLREHAIQHQYRRFWRQRSRMQDGNEACYLYISAWMMANSTKLYSIKERKIEMYFYFRKYFLRKYLYNISTLNSYYSMFTNQN
jgi:hypothetical protein